MEERKKQVLNAIIKDYIANAEPVGSRAVAKKYGLGVSPATIRNEMSDLEEEGYIEQPHTSAGRIPSAKGYRYFVDHLMERERLTSAQLKAVRQAMRGEVSEMEEFMRSCCNMISQLTHYTALVAMPEQGRGTLENIQLVPVSDHQVLVVLLASTGIIRHKLIELPMEVKSDDLAYIEQKMRQHLCGKEIKAISYEMLRDMLADYQIREKMAEQALELIEQTLTKETAHKIFTGGVMNMLSQPEFRDIDKLKSMFALIEEDDKLEKLLNARTIKTGDESFDRQFNLSSGDEAEALRILSASRLERLMRLADTGFGKYAVNLNTDGKLYIAVHSGRGFFDTGKGRESPEQLRQRFAGELKWFTDVIDTFRPL